MHQVFSCLSAGNATSPVDLDGFKDTLKSAVLSALKTSKVKNPLSCEHLMIEQKRMQKAA